MRPERHRRVVLKSLAHVFDRVAGQNRRSMNAKIIHKLEIRYPRHGSADFNRIRYRHYDADVFLYCFDLIELNGDDLRRDPLQVRKATLASVIARAASGLRFNEHMDETDGPLVFQHACKLGLEGIVSKRRVRDIVPADRLIGLRARTRMRPR